MTNSKMKFIVGYTKEGNEVFGKKIWQHELPKGRTVSVFPYEACWLPVTDHHGAFSVGVNGWGGPIYPNSRYRHTYEVYVFDTLDKANDYAFLLSQNSISEEYWSELIYFEAKKNHKGRNLLDEVDRNYLRDDYDEFCEKYAKSYTLTYIHRLYQFSQDELDLGHYDLVKNSTSINK